MTPTTPAPDPAPAAVGRHDAALVGEVARAVLPLLKDGASAGAIARAVIPVVERALAGRVRREALEEAARALEARKPHIPPSTAPNRREALVERSTLNRAALALRALAAPATEEVEEKR